MGLPEGYERVEHAGQRNQRVQQRYDELMRRGQPDTYESRHYETLFRVVREECERYYQAGQANTRFVMGQDDDN